MPMSAARANVGSKAPRPSPPRAASSACGRCGAGRGTNARELRRRLLEMADWLGEDHVAFGTDMNALSSPPSPSYRRPARGVRGDAAAGNGAARACSRRSPSATTPACCAPRSRPGRRKIRLASIKYLTLSGFLSHDLVRPDAKAFKVLGPNVVVMATSAASRPRAISTRPMRGTLLRGSNVCH